MRKKYLGIDIGGTQIRGAIMQPTNSKFSTKNIPQLHDIRNDRMPSDAEIEVVIEKIIDFIGSFELNSIEAIGIGVPGLVDESKDRVVDVLNIPAWNNVMLASIVKEKFKRQVIVENDANCFALGEYYFGNGNGCDTLAGLTIGTGLGTGLVINGKIHSGKNGGAGEFGMMEYNGKVVEYFASGSFFSNVYNVSGDDVYEEAGKGNKEAIRMYEEFGWHLGNAIKLVLYAYDPEVIVLGGSVADSFMYFQKSMRESLTGFSFPRTIRNLRIEVSTLENSGILGAMVLASQARS